MCAAPLPVGERLLVRCAYCAAENVLGLDLRVRSARAHDQASSVGDALRHRRRARIRLVVVILVLLGGAATSFVAYRVMMRIARLPTERRVLR